MKIKFVIIKTAILQVPGSANIDKEVLLNAFIDSLPRTKIGKFVILNVSKFYFFNYCC
jgi:hypothetical protein